MAGNTKQHYVPVVYLSPFAGHDGHVWSLSLEDGSIERRGRRNIFFRRHYYRQDWAPPGADKNILERYFQQEVEPAIHALRKLAEGKTLGDEEAFSCLLYVASQFARVPAQLDQAVELQRQLIGAKANQVPEVREALASGRYQIVMRKSARLDALFTLLAAALKCLCVMEWTVLKAPPFDEFITTDNPVVALNERFFPPATPGLGLRSTSVVFPFSPSITFLLRHRPGNGDVVSLDQEEAASPTVAHRIQVSDVQVAAQNMMVGAYAQSYAVGRSREPLSKLKHDLVALV